MHVLELLSTTPLYIVNNDYRTVEKVYNLLLKRGSFTQSNQVCMHEHALVLHHNGVLIIRLISVGSYQGKSHLHNISAKL